jgi:uncharacterized membrane protein (DUF373 family)
MLPKLEGLFGITRKQWSAMTLYHRFERIVSWILTSFITLMIAVALLRLAVTIYQSLIVRALAPLPHSEFEHIFGMIMTLLIAMEFNHSIHQAVGRQYSIVQVRTVVLITILSLVRKFIILDIGNTSAVIIASIAFAVLALGVVHKLIREPEDEPKGGEAPRS